MKVLNKVQLYLFSLVIALVLAQCDSSAEEIKVPEEEPKEEVVDIVPLEGMDLYGMILDNNGNPIEGVVVSDGYSSVETGGDGIYQMKKNEAAKFVFYSTPASCKIATESSSNSMARFYSKLEDGERYDFKLERLDAIEQDFTLVGIGDPQPYNTSHIKRFKDETIADLKNYFSDWEEPVYQIALGDIVGDKAVLLSQVKNLLGKTGTASFVTIGNHDKMPENNPKLPRNTEAFSNVFGPVNYSFNRGNVHFVCLDNVVFSNSSEYKGGFTSEQIAWLKEDLSYVSKDKMLIVYYHIPLVGSSKIENRNAFFNLLNGFAEVHLFSGHAHYSENYKHSSPVNAYEHVHAAACGSWWKSTINSDGTPNGYAVYRVSGSSIINWYYKPTNYGSDFQIRLHKGDSFFGGEYGYFSYEQKTNTVVANVWNADNEWKIEAFENGVKVADLEPMLKSMPDAWSLGYHIGVLNRDPKHYAPKSKHLFLHKMQNPEANLEVRATDPFGNVYSQSKLVLDNNSAISY